MSTVKLDDGKYAINLDDKTAAMTFYRNGEAWPGGQEAFQHAGVVLALVQRVLELEASNAGLVEALKGCKGFTVWQDEKIDAALAAAGVK